MKEKGFTLIELLAVIVILAIIALIATPIILGIINDAKKQSNQRSAELYLKAAELAIARENLNGELGDTKCEVQEDGNLKCNGKDVKVEMDGTKPASGAEITFSSGKITKLKSFTVGNTKYKLQNGSLKVDDSTEEEEETFTGTIYRNSADKVTIGQTIVPETKTLYCGIVKDGETVQGTSCSMAGVGWDTNAECVSGMADLGIPNATCEEATNTTGLTSYETEETKSNITQNFYLKHEVEDNIVTASYVCIRYTGGEVCIQGGDPSYYGTFDGKSSAGEVINPTGNIAEVAKTRSYFLSNEKGSCYFKDEESKCNDSSLNFSAYSDGTVSAENDSIECIVVPAGIATCRPIS